MFKKLFICFGLLSIVSLIGVIISFNLLFSTQTSDGIETDFWQKSEGVYEVYYTVVGDDGVTSSMINSYLVDIIIVEFSEEDVKLTFSLNLTQEDSMLYIDNNGYAECSFENIENDDIINFIYTANKNMFTSDTLSFKIRIGSMPFEPEFSLLLSVDTAYLKG